MKIGKVVQHLNLVEGRRGEGALMSDSCHLMLSLAVVLYPMSCQQSGEDGRKGESEKRREEVEKVIPKSDYN